MISRTNYIILFLFASIYWEARNENSYIGIMIWVIYVVKQQNYMHHQ